MALTGITITELTPIGNAIHANDVMPIVNLSVDETQKITMQNLGNFILGNIANTSNLTVANLTVSNHTILNTANIVTANISGNANVTGNIRGGNITATSGNIYVSNSIPAAGVFTDNLYYSNGAVWDLQDPVGNAGEVQFNDGDGNFGASNNFVWDSNSNTLNIHNLNLLYANTAVNEGTSEQVLGIIDQDNQTIGWKTLPTNYMNVYLRNSFSYTSSIVPVLRIIPIKARNAPTGYVQIPAA
jgi:hypothetical protein